MEFYFQQSKDKSRWLLYILRPNGDLAWIATRTTLIELQQLVA